MTTHLHAGDSYVFLSYARADHDRVFSVVERLTAAGVRIWVDETAIEGGDDWDQAIVRGIRDCAAVLLMCSPASLASPNVLQEIRVAWTYHRPYLPIILETAEIPAQARYYLEGRQWIEVLDRPEQEWLPRLLDALDLLGVQRRAPETPPPAHAVEPALPASLPAALTSFIGRGPEITRIEAMLTEHRLLTLTGEGGIGKTRLAQEVARAVAGRFTDGVWFVELAALADPALVPRAVAAAVGAREAPDRPLMDALVEQLRARSALLILDNCEHLVTACAALAEHLLRTCPGLRVLATSRERLAVVGEATYRVQPLTVPAARTRPDQTAATLIRADAVRLFVERATAVQGSFQLTEANAAAVAEICRRLDGIPFAIELAAARVKVLSPQQIAERLSDRFRLLTGGSRTALPRQQTLRALVDWSHDLLAEPEKTVLRRLSVFMGGWTLEAAEAICADDAAASGIAAYEILDLLTQLLDKSLITPAGEAAGVSRFGLLETIRHYGGEKLAAGGELAAMQRRHRDWFLRLAEQGGSNLAGPDQKLWLARLEADHDNLRAALAWCLEQRDQEAAVQCAGALWRFWQVRGHLGEGRLWLGKVLAETEAVRPDLRARALNGAGNLASVQSDYEAACDLFEQALSLYREHGDSRGVANALSDLGNVSINQGDYGEADAFYADSLALSREIGDTAGVARSLSNLARIAHAGGRPGDAIALLGESLDLYRGLGDLYAIARTLNNLAILTRLTGDHARAAQLFSESLGLRRDLGDKAGIASTLNNLGAVARAQGDYGEAARCLAESLTLSRELGNRERIATCLEEYAALAVALAQPARAAQLLGAATALRAAIDAPLPPSERAEHDLTLQAAHAALDAAAFEHAWAEGIAWTVDQAVEAALAQAVPA